MEPTPYHEIKNFLLQWKQFRFQNKPVYFRIGRKPLFSHSRLVQAWIQYLFRHVFPHYDPIPALALFSPVFQNAVKQFDILQICLISFHHLMFRSVMGCGIIIMPIVIKPVVYHPDRICKPHYLHADNQRSEERRGG